MEYYPVVKKWRNVKEHINNAGVQRVLVQDFNKFTYGRWRKRFRHGMYPADFESCDWRFSLRGRPPEYFKYVKHAACHWLVNFNLKLAMLVEPQREWRIVTCQKHSTVWDGRKMLFDLNFLALGVPAKESFQLANTKKKHLKIGATLRVYFAQHYSQG